MDNEDLTVLVFQHNNRLSQGDRGAAGGGAIDKRPTAGGDAVDDAAGTGEGDLQVLAHLEFSIAAAAHLALHVAAFHLRR